MSAEQSPLTKAFPILSRLLSLNINYKTDIKFPSIVVVGMQSSGKSTLLEAIVQRSFLPTGDNIVTRCPLALNLKRDSKKKYDFGQFESEEKEFTDFEEIKKEIVRRTNIIRGKDTVSEKAINLTIHSPNILFDLFLVDLPGQTARDEDGGETKGKIKAMITKYAVKEENIILCVSDGGQEVVNNYMLDEVLKFPNAQKRTIGAITKLDTSKSTIAEVLRNDERKKSTYLENGHVGLVCWDDKRKKLNTREEEAAFFEKNKQFDGVIECCGTDVLCKKMQDILLEALRKQLPEMEREIRVQIKEVDAELLRIGESDDDPKSSMSSFFEIVSQFARLYAGYFDGIDVTDSSLLPSSSTSSSSSSSSSSSDPPSPSPALPSSSSFVASGQVMGGAAVRHRILHQFIKDLTKEVTFTLDMSESQLLIEIENRGGQHEAVFPDNKLLVKLCEVKVLQMRSPCIWAVERTHSMCCAIAKRITFAVPRLGCFPRMRRCLEIEAIERLTELKADAVKDIDTFLEGQSTYSTFSLIVGTNGQPLTPRPHCSCSSNHTHTHNCITQRENWVKCAAEDILRKVKTTVEGAVPPAVMLHLVKHSIGYFAETLAKTMYRKYTSTFYEMMTPDPSVKKRREDLRKMKEELETSLETILTLGLPEPWKWKG